MAEPNITLVSRSRAANNFPPNDICASTIIDRHQYAVGVGGEYQARNWSVKGEYLSSTWAHGRSIRSILMGYRSASYMCAITSSPLE
jgi:hypothetical protein